MIPTGGRSANAEGGSSQGSLMRQSLQYTHCVVLEGF
jgi:hypothetical protein